MPWSRSKRGKPYLAVVIIPPFKPMERDNMEGFGRAKRGKTYFVAMFWS
jgi:hypothetical protein